MLFHFLSLHHTISKTLSKIIKKVFLALSGPSFNLAIYIGVFALLTLCGGLISNLTLF
jgi:hypothetical protein